MRRVSMQDIARQAGVSKNAVSLALRNHPSISAPTRERIERLAQSMGYQPHPALSEAMAQIRSQQVQTQARATIGVVHFFRDQAYGGNMQAPELWRSGIRRAAQRLGYGVDHFHFRLGEDAPDRLRLTLVARGIRGIILTAVPDFLLLQESCAFIYEAFACVLLGDIRAHWPALPYVTIDAHLGARLCLSKAVEAGHRRIAFEVHTTIDPNQRFLSSLQSHARTWGLDASIPPFCSQDPQTREGVLDPAGYVAWFKTYRPDCIIGSSIDYVAALQAAGWSPPDDFSYIHWWANAYAQSLSGLDQRDVTRAEAAVDMLVARLHRGERGEPRGAAEEALSWAGGRPAAWKVGTFRENFE